MMHDDNELTKSEIIGGIIFSIFLAFSAWSAYKLFYYMFPGPEVEVIADGESVFIGPESRVMAWQFGMSGTEVTIYKTKGCFGRIEKIYNSKDIKIITVEK